MIDSSPKATTQDESTPLLGHSDEAGATSPCAKCSRPVKQWLVLIVGSILTLSVDFGFFLGGPAQIQIFEDIICQNYYASVDRANLQQRIGPLDEAACKIDPVQSELALINGWKETFDVLPSILLALPYGVLADRIGRKPVLLLGIFGSLLGELWPRIVCWWPAVFPIRLVWLSALWRVIGGGDLVLASLACVIVADIFSEEERATALFRISSAALVAEVLATPISAGLMTLNPWFPYLLGLGIVAFGGTIALFMPETINEAREKTRETGVDDDENLEELDPLAKGETIATVLSRVRAFIDSTHFIWRNTNVMLSLFAFFVATLSRQSTSLLLQYVSKKYHWSIAQASFLICMRGSVNLVNYLVLMPLLSSILTKHLHMGALWKDLRLTQTNGLFLIIGFFIIFVAGTPAVLIFGIVVTSLGSAFAVASRSFATSLVLPDHVGTFYSAATVVQSVGALVAGPLLASIFSLGMRLGDSWLGLPFLAAAVCYLIACIAISCIRQGRRQRSNSVLDGEQDSLLGQ